MKVLYFGTVCNNETFEDICSKSKIKPTAAPQNFEISLLKGFEKIKDIEIEVNSFPPIPTYPGGYKLYWKSRREKLSNNVSTTWLPALNIQVIKQLCFFFFSVVITLVWLLKHRQDKNKVILLYSIYTPVVFGTMILSKIAQCKITVIVPDLPRFMFSYSVEKGLKARLIPIFQFLTKFIEHRFDGYILLTKFMNDALNKFNRPYTVVEGIASDAVAAVQRNFPINKNPTTKKVLMYAGTLNRKFGIDTIIDSIEILRDSNVELWLFGSGDMEQEIKEIAARTTDITYFGRMPRDVILDYQRRADLLVNIRSTEDPYTKYSFPSKTIEYMASGTPLLTSKLPGIPDEYFKYCYVIQNCTASEVAKEIMTILSHSRDELNDFGCKARKYIVNNKRGEVQANRIFNLLTQVVNVK